MTETDHSAAEADGLLDAEEVVERVVLDDEDGSEDATSEQGKKGKADSQWLPLRKLLSATATLGLLIGASYAFDQSWAQPWRADEDYVPFWNLIGREFMGQEAEAEAEAEKADALDELAKLAEAEDVDGDAPVPDRKPLQPPPSADTDDGADSVARYPSYVAHELDPVADEVEHRLANPEALEPFFAALARTDLGYAGAITRAGHWGDSILGTDGIPSAIRRRLQARFGDAGHGFHAIRPYDASYRHQGIVFAEEGNTRWQSCMVRSRCMEDGSYGYGGATARSSGGPTSVFETAAKGSVGTSVSVFELWYRAQPEGGNIRVRIDGGPERGGEDRLVSTALDGGAGEGETGTGADAPEGIVDAWARVELPDGPHRFEVRAAGGGAVQAYGVTLEREGPGVVWDGMALIGAFTKRLLEPEAEHLRVQLQHRELDLMVFTFGGNDMTRDKGDLRYTMDPYVEEYGQVIERFKAARPEAACLIIGPVDHGERVDARIVSRPVGPRMTEAQRQVARDHGCAFFDTLAAMGGPGSVARWKQRSLISGDLAHPTARGHKLIASLVVQALMVDYVAFRERVAGEPMPPMD